MRQIKFRGKRLDNGEWVEGSLFNSIWRKPTDGSRVCYIFPDNMIDDNDGDCWEDFAEVAEQYEVDRATVGQYTGLKDKNGKEIYEGDVLRWFVNDLISTAPVEYRDGAFWMVRDINTGHGVWNDWLRGEYEILGNIHDNPESLKTVEPCRR